MSFKGYNQDQQFLLPPSLHDFLPEGHLARIVNEVVNELDLTELYKRYSDLGCSAYHPQMMVKVLFYGYAMGERSSRVIAHRLKSDRSKKGSGLDLSVMTCAGQKGKGVRS